MNKIILLLVAFCISQFLFAQECTRLFDFYQTQNNDNTNINHPAAAQSWVATCTGQIEAVAVRTQRITATTVDVRVKFIEGTVQNPGSILQNFTYEFTDENQVGQEDIITFPSPVSVIVGQEYSISFERTSANIEYQISTQNPYSEGNFSRLTDLLNPVWEERTGVDMDFDLIVKDDPPTIGCRDITLTLDQNGEASTTFNDLTTNSSDDIGVAIRFITQPNFTCDDVGENVVTASITDTGGQTTTCQSIVTVVEDTDPVLTCPSDIVVQVSAGETSVVVDYDDIMYDDCSIATPDGFTFLAVRNGTSYFVSNTTMNAENAQAHAEAQGGFVATIWDISHNNKLIERASLAGITEDLLIGYSDRRTENFFRWHGDNSGYENWDTGQPDNSGDEDFAVIQSDGTWNDIFRTDQVRYILELSNFTTQTSGFPSGSEFPLGTTTNTFEGTDQFGNVGTCSFTVTVSDESTFITTWTTTTANESITIPTFSGETYDYTVNWGDDDIDSNIDGDATHTYAAAGTHTVRISGIFPRIYFNDQGDKDKILSVEQWGSIAWESMQGAFRGCSNLEVNATDTPDLSNVTLMNAMFRDCRMLGQNSSANWDWDVSTVTNMSSAFRDARRFNQDISGWNVGNVLQMGFMFNEARQFDQDISGWDVSQVTSITWMFSGATNFNQPIGKWDASNVRFANAALNNTSLSTENYDDLLIRWSQLELQPDVDFTATNVTLCLGLIARNILTDSSGFNWRIIDGGLDANCTDLVIAPKVYLQGAFTNPVVGEEDLMRDDLRSGDLIPSDTPYSDGVTIDASVLTTTGNNAIVDWLWVELRDETDSSSVIDGQSALLQRDGDVVATDGISPLAFSQDDGNYFITVNHNNHLGIISATAIALSNIAMVIDFSSDTSLINGGSNSVIDMSGTFAMYTGDFDDSGQVQSTDLNAVIPLLGNSGYSEADLDMNGQIQTTDINLLLIPNLGKGQTF